MSKTHSKRLELDKEALASRFGSRADSYEAATPVQSNMGQSLLDKIQRETVAANVRTILEIGCGTGRLTRELKARFPKAKITAIDISQAMIRHAREQVPGPEYRVGDAEAYLQLPDQQFDLIVSNATVQWFVDLDKGIEGMASALAPGGFLALGTFGERTFHELADAFREAYRKNGRSVHDHVVPMKSVDELRQILPQAEVVEREVLSHFPDVRTFLQSIRDAGAVNSQAGRKAIPRDVLRDMAHYYKARYTRPGSSDIQATYHTCFLFYRRPHA
ncbi:MAG: methyltransferase domain-containing protein [Chromatocurvus sp.]